MRRVIKISLPAAIFLISIWTAAPSPCQTSEDSYLLQNIRKMRIKQQDEETAFRAVIFKNVQGQYQCTPVQMTRERLRGLKGGDSDTDEEDIVINAGNEQVNVTDNHGTISSDVNINITKQGDYIPCP